MTPRGRAPVINATAAALLGLLHDGPMSGGQLVSAADGRFGSFFSVTRSQVYRELPALTEAGLLKLGEQGPRASQQYVITAAGRRAFAAWLASGGGSDVPAQPARPAAAARRRDPRGRARGARPLQPRHVRRPAGVGAGRRARRGRPVPPGRRRLRRRPQPGHGQAAGRDPAGLRPASARTLNSCESRRRSRAEGPGHHAGEHRGGHGPARAARRDRRPLRAGRPPGPVERPGERAEGHQPAVPRPGRAPARRGAAPAPRRPARALRAGRGGGRRGRRSPRPTPSCVKLREDIDELEVRTLLSGEYDEREALVTIRSEAGGVDAADFAEMLMRMYLRWAERHGYPHRGLRHLLRRGGRHQVGDVPGQGAVRLRHAVGRAGHAPAGADLPVRQPGPPADLVRRRRGAAGRRDQPTTSRSTRRTCGSTSTARPGPGGQGVNTTDSAVRLTHLPTGIVVSCQNERSQMQNKASAMAVLQAKLLERRRQEEQAKMDALKGDGAARGATRCAPTCCTRTRWSRTCAPSYEVGNPQRGARRRDRRLHRGRHPLAPEPGDGRPVGRPRRALTTLRGP